MSIHFSAQNEPLVLLNSILSFCFKDFFKNVYVNGSEYLDYETGLPCTSNIPDLLIKSINSNVIYNINGQAIKEPEGLYIQDGKVKFLIR